MKNSTVIKLACIALLGGLLVSASSTDGFARSVQVNAANEGAASSLEVLDSLGLSGLDPVVMGPPPAGTQTTCKKTVRFLSGGGRQQRR